jgi:hypothetical protein
MIAAFRSHDDAADRLAVGRGPKPRRSAASRSKRWKTSIVAKSARLAAARS